MPISSSRSRWKFSFGRTSSSSSSSSGAAPPSPLSIPSSSSNIPMSFICPISSSLMFDPVIVHGHGITPSSGRWHRGSSSSCGFTLPRTACSEWSSLLPSSPDRPTRRLRDAIADFCQTRLGAPRPSRAQSRRALRQDLIGSNAPSQETREGERRRRQLRRPSRSKNPRSEKPSRSPLVLGLFLLLLRLGSSFSSSEMIRHLNLPPLLLLPETESKAPKSPCEAEAP
ncbi:uncharacterized protein A4U43_C03F31960 [Asparagus officinalis]|uniref:Uncharacterized protein n=1 Tax=Asparagus officinalis TaxID=4686 RepID=A0A5P1FJE5_ASPOF|nr:uncharacterized protein A4U43_C03F31960 [Asparagus officinalis]